MAEASVKVMRRFQLEMGGKNPLVVLDDADLGVAVDCAVNGAYFSTGQRCTASSRLIVTEGIHDRFVAAVAEKLKALKVDDPLKEGTQIGPVVDASQLKQDEDYIAIGRGEGAELVWGGERLERDTEGFFLSPALFVGATNAMRISREEIFGPVAGVIRVKDYDEALRGGERHALRAVLGHLHHLAQARHPLQAQRRGGHGDGQPADRRASTSTCPSAGARGRASARASRGATRWSSTPPSRPPTPPPEMAGRIRVGVGGWVFEPWRGAFYPEGLSQKRELEYASRQLTSIEINGTYYGSQKPESFRKWLEETPDDFVFAVKGPRFATNRKVLAEAGESIERFFTSGVMELGHKLGPVNWQFMAIEEVRPGGLRGLPGAPAEGGRRAGRSGTRSRSATRASARPSSSRSPASTGWR